MLLMLNNIDKNEVKEYKNLINDDFIIKNNLYGKKINRNKLVKVAEVVLNNGKIKNVYHTIRTTKYELGSNELSECSNYINIYKERVRMAFE